MLTVKEMSCLESEATENHIGSSTEQHIHQEPVGYNNSLSTEDYNQLVNKYYELEDQRQKILQQLNQFGYWNYNSSLNAAMSQEPEASTSQVYPTVPSSFCPYGCQSWVAPCTSLPCCCSGGACVGKSFDVPPKEAASMKKSASPREADFVKTAMVAAEQALSSLKEQACINSDASACEGKDSCLTFVCKTHRPLLVQTQIAMISRLEKCTSGRSCS